MDEPSFMLPPYEWRGERLPTYEEAIREPKVEVLTYSLHHEAPAAVFYQASGARGISPHSVSSWRIRQVEASLVFLRVLERHFAQTGDNM